MPGWSEPMVLALPYLAGGLGGLLLVRAAPALTLDAAPLWGLGCGAVCGKLPRSPAPPRRPGPRRPATVCPLTRTQTPVTSSTSTRGALIGRAARGRPGAAR